MPPQRPCPCSAHPRSARTRSTRPHRGRLTRAGVPRARQVKEDELAQVKTQGVGQKEEKIQKLFATCAFWTRVLGAVPVPDAMAAQGVDA